MRKLSMLSIASTAFMLAACNSGNAPASTSSPAASASSTPSLVVDVVDHALDRAEAKLRTGNITISGNDGIVVLSDTEKNTDDNGASRLPKAQITPQGELLIGDKPVAITPAQRAMLLDYRQQLIGIAAQGIAIGKQGAALGVHAAGTAIAAVFSGASKEQVRARVEAQASGIRKAAARICDELPALRSSQQRIAADVPAFKPYATLTPAKIDECRKDALHDDDND